LRRHARAPQWRTLAAAVAIVTGAALPVSASGFLTQDLRIAVPGSGKAGLEAVLVRPNEPGRYPLALINHGSPRNPQDRPEMSPMQMWPMAIEFARRGWAAVIVLRRGYGGSGGGWAETYGGCSNARYDNAGRAGAADLRAAIAELAKRADVDATRVISVGVSAGGFAIVALTEDPPPRLVAAISFAGGRGSMADDRVCSEEHLIDAFRSFGRHSKTPMLWVYADNDHFFSPRLAAKFKDAFVAGGGQVDLVMTGPFGNDGHGLFSMTGIPRWTPIVDAFLKRRDLVLREALLPLPEPANIEPPPQLSENGRKAFSMYLRGGRHKAFAVSKLDRFGWSSGRRTVESAITAALRFCREHATDCELFAVDDAPAVHR
jgi:dienelactone hydrolase